MLYQPLLFLIENGQVTEKQIGETLIVNQKNAKPTTPKTKIKIEI